LLPEIELADPRVLFMLVVLKIDVARKEFYGLSIEAVCIQTDRYLRLNINGIDQETMKF
jgi:hypothetical protein